jgi:methylated-DNA-protein-cysteine methyltransferase-like protein
VTIEPTENQCDCTATPASPVAGSHATIEYVPRLAKTQAYDRVLERVRAIPPGFVRTYGDVSPGAPRFAGTVLFDCRDPRVPWFRVVRADGSLAKGERQRRLLDAEGVPFRGERVDMRVARLPE